MERHVDNARAVAAFLESHELASNVTYPGLPGSRYRPLVEKYLPRGAGAVFSFDCAGGRDGGQDLIRGVTLWSHLANVGDAKSLIIHPASTTHRQLSDDELRGGRRRAGNGPAVGRHRVRRRSDLGPGAGFACAANVTMTDLERYQDPLTIQRVLHSAQHDRDRGPVGQRAAGQQLRRLLPQAARLPGDPGQSPRDRDPRRDVLPEPARTCPCRWTS